MDAEQLDELAASIKEHGLIQPLIVTQSGPQTYTLIAGERRRRASQKAGLAVVPVVVKEATPLAMLELAIIALDQLAIIACEPAFGIILAQRPAHDVDTLFQQRAIG